MSIGKALFAQLRMRLMQERIGLLLLGCFWLYFCHSVLINLLSEPYLAGQAVDGLGQLWMSWWASTALWTPGLSPFHCPLINHPVGGEVFTYDVAFVNVLLSGLLRPALGPAGAINSVFVAAVLFDLVCVYVLVRQVTRSRVLAVLLATIPALFAIRHGQGFIDIDKVNHGIMVLAVVWWLRGQGRSGKWRVVVTGMLVAITGIAHAYHGINLMLLLFLGAVLGFARIIPRDGEGPGWSGTLLALAMGTVLILGVLYPSVQSLLELDSSGPVRLDEFTGALVPIPVLGALVLVVRPRSRALWFWLLSTCLFCLLAAGTNVNVSHDQFIPLPLYYLKQYAPLFWRYNLPHPFGTMGIITMTMVLAVLHRELSGQRSPLFSAVAMAGVVAVGLVLAPLMVGQGMPGTRHLSPVPTRGLKAAPQMFHQMRKHREQYVVLELYCRPEQPDSLRYQMVHQKALASDPVRPRELLAGRGPELARLQQRVCADLVGGQPPALPSVKWLREQGVRYVVFSTRLPGMRGEATRQMLERKLGSPVREEARLRFYDLSRQVSMTNE